MLDRGPFAAEAFQHLVDGLVKFRFAGIAPHHFGKDRLQLFIDIVHVLRRYRGNVKGVRKMCASARQMHIY